MLKLVVFCIFFNFLSVLLPSFLLSAKERKKELTMKKEMMQTLPHSVCFIDIFNDDNIN